MATIREVRLVDDLTGGPAVETVEFGLDGATYEIDLSSGNAEKLREAVAAFTAAARRTTVPRRARPARTGAAGGRPGVDREQNQAIRDWARKRGMTIADRGRISAEIVSAYHQAS